MLNLFNKQPVKEKETEHLTMSGLELMVIHSLKTIIIIDQTGVEDDFAVEELEKWWRKQGYHTRTVVVTSDKDKVSEAVR